MAPSPSAPVPVPRRPPPLTLPADDHDSLPRSIDCIAGAISPLKDTVRMKWANASALQLRRSSCGAGGLPTPSAAAPTLAQRLAAADARREAFRTWTMRRAHASAAPRRLRRVVRRGQTGREEASESSDTDADAERTVTDAVSGPAGTYDRH